MKNLILLFVFTFVFTISTFAQKNDIRKFDFNNFTYNPFCVGEESRAVRVKDGKYKEEKKVDDYIERFYFSVSVEGFADVTGDGKEEALINSVCNTGGTGNFTEGFIYTIKNNKPVLLARIEGGDRADGGINAIRKENDYLVVERNDPGNNGGACCPRFSIKSRYKLKGAELVPVGTPVKCELYPALPLEFERGKTGTSFKLILPKYDSIRFKVAASAGQTLEVSSNSKNIFLRVFEGEAQTLKEGNSLQAKLKETGDYIFEITNNLDKEHEFTLNVSIK